MYNLISNIQNTMKLKATKLTQGKKVLKGTTEGKIKIMLMTDFKLMVAQQSGKGPNLKVVKWW